MEFMSESSADSKSFGLLDDNLLQDVTLSNNNNSNEIKITKVKDKPPIPTTTVFKKKPLSNYRNAQTGDLNELNYDQENMDPAEETAVSIKLNESDLKQLDDEFTFADDSEGDDENQHKQNHINQTLSKQSPNKTFDFPNMFNKNTFKKDLILNESADILRNSNEFEKIKPMSYDMTINDESNLIGTNINSTTNNPDITLNQIANSTTNMTVNFSNETATNRINELVSQSVERFKRRAFTSFGIESNDLHSLNASNNPTKEMLQNKQFSPANIKPFKLEYNTSTMSNFDDNLNNLTQNVNHTLSFATPSVDLQPVESLKDTNFKESMSFYFKPSDKLEQTAINLNQTQLNEQQKPPEQEEKVTFIQDQHNMPSNPFDNSMFVNNQAQFQEFNEINSNDFKSDALNFINQEENENRMFETSVNQSTTNSDTSNSSSGDTSMKWWKHQDQAKLHEQSKAQEYFNINSTLPSFLAGKDADTTYSMLKQESKKNSLDSVKETSTEAVVATNNDDTVCEEKHDSDDITFSTTKNHLSDNFSFTLNASETGEFIIKKKLETTPTEAKTTSTTPFQVTKMLNAYQQKKATGSNLKTIGEELDRVSNRLAISNDSMTKTTMITTAITTTTTTDKSLKHKNNQLILTMDETISSINSSSNRSANLVKQQSKQKLTSGSLTSTPSKLNKKVDKSFKKDDQTEMTTTSNNLLNQASFISSIPERNDSTLVGNHHQHQHLKSKRPAKHAEIQTSPDKSTSSSSSSSSTASFSSDAPTKLSEEKTNTIASQMVAINNLAASLLNSNNINNNDSNSNRTSLFNSSNNNGLIPVAFLPVDAVFPYMQKIYDNYQSKSIDLSTNSMRQQASGLFSDLNNTAKFKLELPVLEIDKNEINFGHIAEGCSDSFRLCIKLTNTNLIQFNRDHNVNANLLIEFKDEDWSIRQNKHCLDDTLLKTKLTKTLGVCTDKKPIVTNKTSLKLNLTTNYYELFIHLNTANFTYFKDLIYHQQIDSRSHLDDADDKSLEPLNISTKLSIYYSFMDNNNFNKYLLNHVGLKFDLGYARLRSSVSLNTIEFEMSSLFSNSNDNDKSNVNLNIRSNDIDKTLTSNCSKDDTCLWLRSKNLIDQLIPLSNGGNIPINVNCYLVSDTTNESICNDETKHNHHRMLSLKENQFQIKIDKSLISLDARSTMNIKKQLIRLTLLKLIDSNQITSFDDLKVHLILQIKPNGFKYEIPIIFKQSKIATNVSKLKKVASLDSTTSATTVAKIATSKSIIFFGRTLNSNIKFALSDSVTSGLVSEFLIRNLNDFKIRYELNLITCMNDSNSMNYDQSMNMSSISTTSLSTTTANDKLISKSSIHLFKFTNEMKEFTPKDDQSMTRLIIQIEPKEHVSISVKFNSSLLESDKTILNQQYCFGMIKINTIGFNQKFNLFLVGFLNKSQLCLDTNENKLIKKSDLNDDLNRLERQICGKNIQLFNFKYQLTSSIPIDDTNCSFRRTIQLHNKSLNSRVVVYPILFEISKEINSLYHQENQLVFDLDQSNETNVRSKFKLDFDTNKLNYSNNVAWIDLAPNEQLKFDILVEFKQTNKQKLSESYDRIEKQFDQLNLCLFWIEFDINMHCLNGAQFLQDISTSFDSQIDVLIKKFLSLNPRSFKAYNKSDPYFVNGIISKKARLQYDNMISLMMQSIKCSNLKMSLLFKSKMDQTIDFTLTSNREQSILNESLTPSLNESKSLKITRDASWSLLNDTIVIQNLKFDQLANYTTKVHIRNNLSKNELFFNSAFNSGYIDVEPNRGCVQPMKTLEITVRARKEIAKQLPWHGIITLICNKTEKDIKVSFYSGLAPTRLNSSSTKTIPNSLSNKSIKPPPPIPSLTLPTLSYKSKLNDQIKNSVNNSSSLSSVDSSPFLLSSTSSSTTLEQGTVISEITQNTIDSLSLTPLINASFQMTASKLHHQQQQQRIQQKTDDSIIKILHYGNYAQIQFPAVSVLKSKTYDFTLINPTNNYVNWKAHSTNQTQLNHSNDNSMIKSTSNVFKMTPNSGVIPANQKQIIKIEFSPRDECGNFQELWEIDTRTSSSISYNCKIYICGKSILNDDDQSNILAESNCSQRSTKSTSHSSKYKISKDSFKENYEPSSITHSKTIPDYDQTIESNKTSLEVDYSSLISNSLLSNRKITLKTEELTFPDTTIGSKSKAFLVIDNKEDKRCNLNIYTPMQPFYCKHLQISIESKHYIKVPIEFKPEVPGDYIEKLFIRFDNTDAPLTCVIKAKCIASK